ncbi:MAG: FIST C-terminal domain-containing protein [Sulfuricella sp.]|nr:FIST C-terminal domain-containing protein [Sulfuricella sp.]
MAMKLLQQADAREFAALIDEWRGADQAFHVLAFFPEPESAQVAVLQAVCRESGIPLAGAVFPELIDGATTLKHGALLLRVDQAPPPLLIEGVGKGAATEQIAGYVEDHLGEDGEAALFCLFDALVPTIATQLDALYLRLADRVRYFGVNAGNERFVSAPCLFDSERFVADALLLQLLPDHPGACLEHGYAVPNRFITATSAQGNRIVQIDWQPALEVYREVMALQYGVTIDRDNFYAHAVHFPFGILRADGEVLVRIPVALDEAGGIVCVGEIPPNSVLALLDARAGSGEAAAALAGNLADGKMRPGDALLLFYCAGRRMHIGAGMADELRDLMQRSGVEKLVGALSLGEIGESRSGGYPLFHNATLVGVPWPNC